MQRDDEARDRIVLRWGIVCVAVAFSGMYGLLLLAGIDLLHWFPLKLPGYAPQPLDPAARGHVVTAAVSWMAGVIGLGTYFLNREQKDRQHTEQLEAQNLIEERKRIDEEFRKLSEDFSSDNTLTRINAAINLARVAQIYNPNVPRIDKYGANYDPNSFRELFPWFFAGTMQLCAALIHYDNRLERTAVLNSIQSILQFAADPLRLRTTLAGRFPLLDFITDELVKANRTIFREFKHVLAQGLANQYDTLTLTAPFRTILPDLRTTNSLRDPFDDIVADREFQAIVEVEKRHREAVGFETGERVDAAYFKKLSTAAAKLIDSRDTLVSVLSYGEHLRSKPFIRFLNEAKTHELRFNDSIGRMIFEKKDLPRPANFDDVFLSKADLSGFHLEGISFGRSWMHGVDLSKAKLAGANFWSTKLASANLVHSDLAFSWLLATDLKDANVYGCDFQGAMANVVLLPDSISHCNFVGADLNETDLSNRRIDHCNFSKAKLSWAIARNSFFHQVSFSSSLMDHIQFEGSRFEDCDMSDALLFSGQFAGLDLTSTQLVGTIVTGSNLGQHEGFDQAAITKESLSEIDFRRPEWSNELQEYYLTEEIDFDLAEFLAN